MRNYLEGYSWLSYGDRNRVTTTGLLPTSIRQRAIACFNKRISDGDFHNIH